MEEPHQRSRSGLLTKPTKNANKQKASNLALESQSPPKGISSKTSIEPENEHAANDDFFDQTPTSLTQLHISILTKVKKGICQSNIEEIDPHWRKTWNIGMWNISGKLCMSCCIMQPNISGCWVDVKGVPKELLEDYAQKLRSLNLQSSTCRIMGNSYPKIQGRWSLTLAQRLLDDNLVSRENVQISNVNISNSKIFFWLVLNTRTTYLCTMTLESTEVLSRYIPDSCYPISEVNSAKNFSIRMKDPIRPNDASQLTINKHGFVQYTGREENIEHLWSCIRQAIHATVNGRHVKSFLHSLTYTQWNITG